MGWISPPPLPTWPRLVEWCTEIWNFKLIVFRDVTPCNKTWEGAFFLQPCKPHEVPEDGSEIMGSTVIALLFLDHGTRRGWGISVTPRLLFTPGKDPVPILREAVWALGAVWTGTKNLASTGIRCPDRPARSQSLYRLCYPAHYSYVIIHMCTYIYIYMYIYYYKTYIKKFCPSIYL